LFPEPEALAAASEEDLKCCSLGYRVPYIIDAAKKVCSGEIDINILCSLNNEALMHTLKSIHGVGDKVANCVMLFGFGRLGCVPVDVWISRTIEREYCGKNPFAVYGDHGGVLQQYIFYYMINKKGRL
jgi:N-glycosylase/DNA lyase